MKKLLVLVTFLILLLGLRMGSVEAAPPRIPDGATIAVMGITNKSIPDSDLPLEDASIVADFLVEDLLDDGRFNVLDREYTADILAEQARGNVGIMEPGSAAAIGKLIGTKYFLYGSIVGLSTKESEVAYDNSMVGGVGNQQHKVRADVTVRIIDVETGRIVLAGHGRGSSTSTHTEFTLNHTHRSKPHYTTTYDEYTGEEVTEEEVTETGITHMVTIGTTKVSLEQAENALYKAAEDAVYGEYGILTKLEGRGKQHKRA